ncbi:hypothetical protein ACTA71_008933 [Dictyostelium dimigraforme]
MVSKKEFIEELTRVTNDLIKRADKNGDKKLSKDEVLDIYKKSKYPNPTLATNSLFELFDEDEDGQLSFDEVRVAALVDYIIMAETAIKQMVDKTFKADTNKDDKISFEEAKQAFIKSGSNEKAATVYALSMFSDVDSDHDNSITREELRQYAIKYYEIYPSQ